MRLIDADALPVVTECCMDEAGYLAKFNVVHEEDIKKSPTVNALVLPCKVGDFVWLVFTPKHPANPADKGKWFMVRDGVQRIIYGAKGISIETWNMGTIPEKEVGKKLFFTSEDAEAELAERKMNHA